MANAGLLLDMDGVIYRGSHLIDGAAQFLKNLRSLKIPYLFLTNNSQRTRRDVVIKLKRLGIEATEDDVFTCAMATARFLASQKAGGTAYVIGENGLANALHVNGYSVVDDDADYVVVGEGRTLSFEMIEQGVRLVEKGAKLIATNPDTSCPTEEGIRPGCGAIVAMIEKATGVTAFSVGKPSPVMMRMARKQLGLRTAETIMVGDTMYTDVLGGVQLGYRTVLVLSGHTTREDLIHYAYRPDRVENRLADVPIDWVLNTPTAQVA
ncbi:MAG: TIGR01457 family HAD-type hydrolase [Verrucomicrobiota bacterium]